MGRGVQGLPFPLLLGPFSLRRGHSGWGENTDSRGITHVFFSVCFPEFVLVETVDAAHVCGCPGRGQTPRWRRGGGGLVPVRMPMLRFSSLGISRYRKNWLSRELSFQLRC